MTILHGNVYNILPTLPDNSIDSIVTDPPYEIAFMGKRWDSNGVAFDPEVWAECLRVLKPGGHLLAFGGTRTWHRLACAIEDAGFEIRDSIAWLYGSGFPKSMDVSKAIDKAAGAERTTRLAPKAGHENFVGRDNRKSMRETGTLAQDGGFSRPWMSDPEAVERAHWDYAPATPEAERWQGWGTALKPGHEPIVVARKPFKSTVAANVLAHGTGALNIDATRVDMGAEYDAARVQRQSADTAGMNGLGQSGYASTHEQATYNATGRWPANVVLDETQAEVLDEQSGQSQSRIGKPRSADSGEGWGMTATGAEYSDKGGASRFFYVAKAPKSERPRVDGVAHPTVKPLALMRWLVRLVTPSGGVVLAPYVGSGTTVEAAILEGFEYIAIERDEAYLPLIQQRIDRQAK